MNKKELCDVVAKECQCHRILAETIIDKTLEIIEDAIKNDPQGLSLVGFGRFYKRHSEEQICRNLRTGEKVLVPPRDVPKFKFSEKLKDRINQ